MDNSDWALSLFLIYVVIAVAFFSLLIPSTQQLATEKCQEQGFQSADYLEGYYYCYNEDPDYIYQDGKMKCELKTGFWQCMAKMLTFQIDLEQECKFIVEAK